MHGPAIVKINNQGFGFLYYLYSFQISDTWFAILPEIFVIFIRPSKATAGLVIEARIPQFTLSLSLVSRSKVYNPYNWQCIIK